MAVGRARWRLPPSWRGLYIEAGTGTDQDNPAATPRGRRIASNVRGDRRRCFPPCLPARLESPQTVPDTQQRRHVVSIAAIRRATSEKYCTS